MINVKNLTKVFYPNSSKEVKVLDNVNLSLPDTGMIFIVGQSGIGKSTILNALGGLINYEGEITYDNVKVDIEKYRKENIGVIFQDFLLFDDVSIKDNILVGLENAGINSQKEVDYRVAKLLDAVNLHVNALRKAGDLSLGQKQRVAIARALATMPKIILADEPTGNLDSANAYKIMDILKSLSRNHLIVCVTHNQTLVKKYADYAFSINNKKIEKYNIDNIQEDKNFVDSKKIYSNNLTKSDIKEGNLLLKVYSDDSTIKDEIQIIKRGDKILVVGENISVAKPSEVVFVNKEEEKEKIIDEKIDLDFDNIKSKKTLKGLFKHYFLTNKLKQSNAKKKRKVNFVFNNISKILFSTIIFIVANIFFATVRDIKLSIGDVSTKSQVLLNANKAEEGKDFSIQRDTILQMINNPESGIIEDSFYNPTYVYVQQSSSLLSGVENLVPNLVGGYLGASIITNVNDVHSFTSLFDQYVPNKNIYFYSFEKAKKDGLCPELEKYDISDNEVLLNKSLASALSSKEASEFINKEISISLNSDTSYFLAPLNLKIKAIVDTPYNVCFIKNDLANLITFNDLYKDSYQIYPNLKDVTFVDYEDIKNNPDYTFTNSNITDETITTIIGKETNKSFMLFSKSMFDEIAFEQEIIESEIKLLKNRTRTYFTTSDLKVTYNPQPEKKVICFKDRSINYAPSEEGVSEKINAAKNKKEDSKSAFGFNYIKSQIINNSSNILPSNINDMLSNDEKEEFNKGNYIIVPNKMLSTFGFDISSYNSLPFTDRFSLSTSTSNNAKVYKTYEGEIDDKVYISSTGFNYLKFACIYNGHIPLSYDLVSLYSDKASVYKEFIDQIKPIEKRIEIREYTGNPSTLLNTSFLSNDVNKTKEFFDEYKYGEEDLQGYLISDVRSSFLKEAGLVNSLDVLITLGVFTLVYFITLFTNGYSKANYEKYYYGVLRNIGKTRKEVNLENTYSFLFEFSLFSLLPILLVTMYLSIFNLFFMGLYIFIFLIGILIISFVCELVPSFIMLARTPNGIIRSLN